MKVVGQSLPKIDALPIATGQPVYTEDLAPSQALVVKVLHSPHAFARLRQVDVSLALKVPGVACVLTHQDVPQERFTLAGQSYPEPSPYDRRILDEYVRYVGDAVAIVAAVDEKTAEKALQLIRVEYEVLEPVLDFETAARHASVVHPEDNVLCNFPIGMEKEKNIICTHKNEYGDVEAELAQCPVVVEETYYTQAQAHGMMETYRAYSYLDHAGRLTIVSSTQIPFHVRRQMARALEMPASRIRVIKPRIGGGFGGKQTGAVEMFVAAVTKRTGKAAIIVYSRTETFSCTNSRHAMRLTVRLGADEEGTIRAVDIQGLSDGGAYGEHAPTTFSVVGEKTLPMYHKAKAVRFMGQVVYTNKLPGGALRGYGATQGTFAQESAVNLLAARLKMNPVELRQKNLIRQGDYSPIYKGKVLASSTLDQCIATGKKLIGWEEKYPVRDFGDTLRAVGMAVTMQGSGIAGIDTASAEIRLNDDGNYTLLIGSTDMGTGSDTILAQMAAEVLETNLEHLIVHAADTDVSPFDPGSYASSTTYVTGMAVKLAAEELRGKMLEQAAKLLEADGAQISFDGVKFWSEDGKRRLTVAKLAERMALGAGCQQLTGQGTYGSPTSPPPFVAGFAEVEIDKATGKVTPIDFVAVVDCGTVINPALARVQTEGGVVQGIGMALYEEVRYTGQGRLETCNFMQYKIPCRKDVGNVRVAFEPSYEPTGPFGAKSIGEAVINTPAPAIAHAVFNATGVQLTQLPLTPEKVLNALLTKKRG